MSAVAVIPRPYYLQRLDELRENALIKVILGPRRCGKSFLLEMYQTRLKESGVDEQQLIVTNLDDYDSRYTMFSNSRPASFTGVDVIAARKPVSQR